MKFYKTTHWNETENKTELSRDEALWRIRRYNPEYCDTRTDEELIATMLRSRIYTNIGYYWAVSGRNYEKES